MNRPLARIAVSALCVSLLSHSSFAVDPGRAITQYVHRIWQIQQGLPQATIYSIIQDSRGYLWLGTQAGLVRFDGVRFSLADGALRNAWVEGVVEDKEGNLWVGTRDRGVFRLHDAVVERFGVKQGLPSDGARDLLVDHKGGLWVSTSAGTVRILSGKVTARLDTRAAGDRTGALCEASDGAVWSGGDSSQLQVWNGVGVVRYQLASVPVTTEVQAMLAASDNSVWVGTSDGLVHVAAGKEKLFTKANGLADNSVLAIRSSSDGSVWVGTKNGFSRLRDDEIQSFGTEDGLSQSTVYSVYEDREGSLWVGTKHGLNQFFDGRTIPYTTKEGLPSNATGPVIQDRQGNIWVGTLDSGLGRYDGRRFMSVTSRDGLSSNTVRALAEDRDGALWVGTEAGLDRLRNRRIEARYTTANGLPANKITCLAIGPNGQVIVGTSKGIVAFEPGRFAATRMKAVAPTLGTDGISALAIDGTGNVVAATMAGGVTSLSTNGAVTPMLAAGAPVQRVDALYADEDGALWMGTVGDGLWLARRGKMVRYAVENGLFDDEIYAIVPDAEGRIWMACSKGVFFVSRSDLLKFADGSIRSFASTPFSPTEALRTIECRAGVQPGVWRMNDGRLWFSTIRGIIVIDPVHLERKLPPTPVVIEDVVVNGQREASKDVTSLGPGLTNIEFDYTALSFVAPTRIGFHYILDGFDRNWVNAENRRVAFYTNLPPGTFRFRVAARNVDGGWTETASPVSFTVVPRLYERGWFIPLCVALAALVAWAIYRLRVRRIRADFAIVLSERNRIARELHDTLIQGFAGITMEMQALVARLRGQPEKSTLEDIIHDAGATLTEARRSLAGLRNVQGFRSGLPAALAEAARQATDNRDVRLKLRIDDDIPEVGSETVYNVVRIAREAITNAVNHSGSPTVEVSLRHTPRGVEMSVKDAGEGFIPDEVAYVRAGHYGVAGMRERAEQIGATFTLSSGPGAGTLVTVLLEPSAARNETP